MPPANPSPLDSTRGMGASAGRRVGAALAVGVVVALVLIVLGQAKYGPALGWDAGSVTLLGWTWFVVWPMDSTGTAAHATREDPTRPVSDVLVLAASVASLAAVAFFLVQAGSAHGSSRDVLAAVGVVTVAFSWLVVHTVFALRYARLYYGRPEGGVSFNQDAPPRYSDFAYLSFTLGMAFQVSDTDLQTTAFRTTVLKHALLSYLLSTVIVATTINLVASLAA